MRKMLCLLLALALLTGCVPQSLARNEIGVHFYYESKEPDYFSSLGVLGCEDRTLPESQNNLEDLLRLYLGGPVDPSLSFPKGLGLVGVDYAQQEITLILDDSLAEQTGIRLQIVCAGIARTVWEFRGYETVNIRAEHALLEDRECITVHPEKLVLEDSSAGQPNARVQLYFSDLNSRFLVGEQCSAPVGEGDDLPRFIVEHLIEGPQSDSLRATIPEGTRLLSVSVVDGICMVNFSEEFWENRPQTALEERMTVFSVVDSLAQLEEVDAVDIRVQGEKKRYLHLDLSKELLPDQRMIGSVRPGFGEYDATLYVCLEGSGQLAVFPMCFRESVGTNHIGTVMEALCTFTDENGYYSPAKELVISHEEEQSGALLTVSVTTEPMDEAQQRLLEHSVIATMNDLSEVTTVRLIINGVEVRRGSDPMRSEWILP